MKRPATLQATLLRDSEDIDVTVQYEYHAASRGYRNSVGVPEEPDEDAYVEIYSVLQADGTEVDLTTKEEAWLTEVCFEDAEIQREDAALERAERNARD